MNQTEIIHFFSDSLKLEGIIEYDNSLKKQSKNLQDIEEFAIICHPHPSHGGTMNNKVVYSLIKACTEKNIPTLRFNFRGVGNSQGIFGNVDGEMNDLISAIKWIKEKFNPKKIRLGGFSFGSYIALKIYCKSSQKDKTIYTKPLIIAPPVGVEGYQFETLNPNEALIVIGKNDEIVDETKVSNWVLSKNEALDYIRIGDCEHFFHRKTVLLRNLVMSFV